MIDDGAEQGNQQDKFTVSEIAARLEPLQTLDSTGKALSKAEIEGHVRDVMAMKGKLRDVPRQIRGGLIAEIRQKYEGVIGENAKAISNGMNTALGGASINLNAGGAWEDQRIGTGLINSAGIRIRTHGNGRIIADGVSTAEWTNSVTEQAENKAANITVAMAQVLFPMPIQPDFGHQIARVMFGGKGNALQEIVLRASAEIYNAETFRKMQDVSKDQRIYRLVPNVSGESLLDASIKRDGN